MERTFQFDSNRELQILCGRYDENLRLIESEMDVVITQKSSGLNISGKRQQVDKTVELFDYLRGMIAEGSEIKKRDISYAVRLAQPDEGIDFKKLAKERIDVTVKGKLVTPKSKGQMEYVEAIKHNDIVFGMGPAGTGKTYLAMAMAVNAFKKGLVRRIILTRPAIEAGENLGFLPGDMIEKVSPYLRPLYDAIYEMMDAVKVEELSEQGLIEVAPLAFMRGRTLNDAFVILDEAQNSTPFQMKMFLTRLGFDSKTVITGDITQSDLPKGTDNGLVDAARVLKGIKGIEFVQLTGRDVVRHELVQRIIEAYERPQKK
ncbi:MAG: PhoH family protein [Candidatus Omnitrophica bacterium]|nr:PhoH family protein [Candidatus Omnitrophota bacterium]MCB9720766.1 PhoH family protein [Candidatus Omnitrophota bacterium]